MLVRVVRVVVVSQGDLKGEICCSVMYGNYMGVM